MTAGTAGTAITDLTAPGLAQAKLNRAIAPQSGRIAMVDSITMSQMVNARATWFNQQSDIGKQNREGFITRTSMADFYTNEKMWTLTNGVDITIDTDAAALVVDGSNVIDFHTATSGQCAIGSVFTLSGIYDCHPETKQPYGNLKQWALASGGATTGSSTVSENIYLTGPYKNCCAANGDDLTPASFNAATMTFVGLASTSYVQGLMFHPTAFQFVNAPLARIGTKEEFSQKTFDGLSISVMSQGDIINYKQLFRLDILYGWAALQPNLACRLIGSAAA